MPMAHRLPPCVVLRMGQHTPPTTPAIILHTRNSALVLSCLRNVSVRPLHGALALSTLCAAMSLTNIVLVPPISHCTNCWLGAPVRCRGRVYELRLAYQPTAASPCYV